MSTTRLEETLQTHWLLSLTVACPRCGAAAGEQCRPPFPGEYGWLYHSIRYADALLCRDSRDHD